MPVIQGTLGGKHRASRSQPVPSLIVRIEKKSVAALGRCLPQPIDREPVVARLPALGGNPLAEHIRINIFLIEYPNVTCFGLNARPSTCGRKKAAHPQSAAPAIA